MRLLCLLCLSTACSQNTSPADTGPATDTSTPSSDLQLAVGGDTYLDELETEEQQTLCTWMVEIQGGPHTEDCGDGVSVTIDPVEDCLARTDWPHCRVSLIEDCIRATGEDICASSPPECDTFYACVYGTG